MSAFNNYKKSYGYFIYYGFFIAIIFIFSNSIISRALNLSNFGFLAVDMIFSVVMILFFMKKIVNFISMFNDLNVGTVLTKEQQWFADREKPYWFGLFMVALFTLLMGVLFIKYIPLIFGFTKSALIMGGAISGLGVLLFIFFIYQWVKFKRNNRK